MSHNACSKRSTIPADDNVSRNDILGPFSTAIFQIEPGIWMYAIRFSRNNFVDRPRNLVRDFLLAQAHLGALLERRQLVDHVDRYVEHDRSLGTIGCASVNLAIALAIRKGVK